MPTICAHRGASAYAPENTMEAFELAVMLGADSIELDVHMTKDGELVVAHDPEVSRVSNGRGFIRDMTLSQLKRLRFNRSHPEFVNATIPTLAEVYWLIKPTSLTINTELKNGPLPYDRMEEKCIKLADDLGMKDRVLYSSFSYATLMRLKKIDPEVKAGLLRLPLNLLPTDKKPIDPWELAHVLGIDAIHPHFSELRLPGALKKAHDLGMRVNVWTTNDEADILESLERGADALIGDYPDRMYKARQTWLAAQNPQEQARDGSSILQNIPHGPLAEALLTNLKAQEENGKEES